MVVSILTIAIILGLGGLWLSRGFYSALINLVAVVLAGAIAFAAWEPLAHAMLDKTDDHSFLQGSAWGLALGGTFAVATLVLRLILDGLLRSNVKMNQVVSYIGGGVCGAIAGLITAGIGVIAIGFLRLDTGLWKTGDDEESGYLNVEYDSNGSMKKGADLWVPADKIVAALYGGLSRTTLRSGEENLGTLYPDLAYVPTTLRYTYGMGKGRNTARTKDFEVLGSYTVGRGKSLDPDQLLSDFWTPTPQRVSDFDGGSPAKGSYLTGLVLRFKSSSRELGGDSKIAVGNAQVRLLARKDGDPHQSVTLFPVAAVAQGEASKVALARFRFDAKQVFIASVGGASDATFGMEFVVPEGYAPTAVFVKGARAMLGEGATAKPLAEFGFPAERDAAAQTLTLFSKGGGGGTGGTMDTSKVVVVNFDPQNWQGMEGLRISTSLPQMSNKMFFRTINLTDEPDNKITDGDQMFLSTEIGTPPTERNLQVRDFDSTPDTQMVQLEVSVGRKGCWATHPTAALKDDAPAVLVDTNGVRYEPLGYIHKDAGNGNVRIRFKPSDPIGAIKNLPTVTRSRPQDTLTLLYRVSKGVKLKYFGVGNTAIIEWKPAVDVNG